MLGASVRQPVVPVALHPLTLTTDRTLAPPTFATYAVFSCGIRVTAFGNELKPGTRTGVACSFRGRPVQPEVVLPLHGAVLMTDSVSSKWFTAKAVPQDGSRATDSGFAPVVTVAHAWPQPAVTRALQRAPLMTETVPSLSSAV